jgi:hypothetical protein
MSGNKHLVDNKRHLKGKPEAGKNIFSRFWLVIEGEMKDNEV